MNIAKEIKFSGEKPFVLAIRNTENTNVFAIGLIKNQVLPKHKSQLPTLLIVLQGTILFRINSEEMRLTALDTYEIPIDTEHDVTGLDEENIFMITKGKT